MEILLCKILSFMGGNSQPTRPPPRKSKVRINCREENWREFRQSVNKAANNLWTFTLK